MNYQLYIIWSKENEIGVPIIDEQHRSIVSTINTFHYYVQKGIGEKVVLATLRILEQYTKLHFETEEDLMGKAGFPDFEDHRALHQTLADRTKHIVLTAQQEQDADEVLRFLRQWWMGHINAEDRKYVPYVNKLFG